MKAKKGFNLRNVCGEYIIVAEGKENIDFSNIISMNESSALLWKELDGKEITIDGMVDILTANYEVGPDEARNDAALLLKQWQEAGIVE